jgi:hypothetical protein
MNITYTTQNDLLLNNLLSFYRKNNNLEKMVNIINGTSEISLRIVDWFTTNYAKKNFTVYSIKKNDSIIRFKVYMDYKLQLKAYSKRRFDPFCRWDRISIPYNETEGEYIQTTLGQLNFFKWAFENGIIEYVRQNYKDIEDDMNRRNSNSKSKDTDITETNDKLLSQKHIATQKIKKDNYNHQRLLMKEQGKITMEQTNKTRRKKREELSISAAKSIKKENVEIVVKFD